MVAYTRSAAPQFALFTPSSGGNSYIVELPNVNIGAPRADVIPTIYVNPNSPHLSSILQAFDTIYSHSDPNNLSTFASEMATYASLGYTFSISEFNNPNSSAGATAHWNEPGANIGSFTVVQSPTVSTSTLGFNDAKLEYGSGQPFTNSDITNYFVSTFEHEFSNPATHVPIFDTTTGTINPNSTGHPIIDETPSSQLTPQVVLSDPTYFTQITDSWLDGVPFWDSLNSVWISPNLSLSSYQFQAATVVVNNYKALRIGSGSTPRKNIDGVYDSNPTNNYDIHFDLTEIGPQLGTVIGSSLGEILAGSNQAQAVLYSSLIGTLGNDLGTLLVSGKNLVTGLEGAVSQAFGNFGSQFQSALQNASVGSISSILFMDLGNEVGIQGFGSQLVTTAASAAVPAVVSQVLKNISANPTAIQANLFNGFTPQNLVAYPTVATPKVAPGAVTLVANAIGSFFGAKLGSLVYSPQTEAGEALASLGSAVGSWALTTTSLQIGSQTLGGFITSSLGLGNSWLALNFVAPGIGAFVGFVLGAIIGDLFGGSKPRIPTASAQSVLQIPYANYQVANISSSNGGSTNPVVQMAGTAANTLNGIFEQIAGSPTPLFVANTASPTQVYGYTGSQLWLKEGGTSAAQINVTTEDQAVDQGVLWALPQTQVIGGNVFLKRAIQNTSATSVTALMGDLQVASDFSFYEQNTALINSYISAAYNTLSTAQQAYYAANQALINQIDVSGIASLTAAQLSVYNANQATINAIVNALQAQSIANPWIITLQRANELNLENFSKSDFFGGLPGFLSSFGLNGMNGISLADLSVGWDGTNLTLTLPSGEGAGVFSTLPQANATGNAVTIGNFDGIMGYANWGGTSTGGQEVINYGGSGAAVNINLTRVIGTYVGSRFVLQNLTDQNDIVIGGNGGNYIVGGAGNAWIQGGAGNNYLQGGSGTDVLVGGSGHNELVGGPNGSIFVGSAGDNAVDNWNGLYTNVAGQNIGNFGGMYATGGVNTFIAGSGYNNAWGSGGADTYVANKSSTEQYFDGGGGDNTISFQNYSCGVNVNLNDFNYGWIWDGQPLDLVFPVSGQTIYTVNTQNIVGSPYNDTLESGPGGGVLEGSGGADTLIGGGGITTASYQHSSAGVYVNLQGNVNNLLTDPNFSNYTTTWQNGWTYYLNNGVVSSPGSFVSVSSVDNYNILTSTLNSSAPSGTQMNVGSYDPSQYSKMFQVTPGQTYSDAAYIASSHGAPVANYASLSGAWATGVWFGMEWWTATGTYISSPVKQVASGGSFANGLASAIQVSATFVAPSNAAYGELLAVGFDDGTGPLTISIADPSFQAGTPSLSSMLEQGQAYGGDATGDTFQNIQNVTGSNYNDTLQGLPGSVLSGLLGNDTYEYSGGGNKFIGGSGFNIADYSSAPGMLYAYLNSGYGYVSGKSADYYTNISQIVGSPSGSVVYGSSTGTTFEATGGTNTFVGQGNDNIYLNQGGGQVTVSDTPNLTNTITVGPNLTFDNLWIGTAGGSNGWLQIGVRGTSDQITVNGNFGASTSNNIIKTLSMDGAASVDIGQVSYALGGNGQNGQVITGWSNQYNMIYAYGGNSTIYADGPAGMASSKGAVVIPGATTNGGTTTIWVSQGDDQICLERGDGHFVVQGDTGGNKSIIFGPTVAATDVIYQIDASGNLWIGLSDPNNPTYTASQVANNVEVIGGGDEYVNKYLGTTTWNSVTYVQAGGTSVNLQQMNLPWVMVNVGSPHSPGNQHPVVFDLNGDGLELGAVAASNIVVKDPNGIITQLGWVGPTNGILVTDRAGNGQYNTLQDLSFVGDTPGATTDLQGLASWDTNHNGVIDSGDAGWSKLKIWVDRNQDGVVEPGELYTLSQLGITSISLHETSTGATAANSTDSYASGEASFTYASGATGSVYDVTLARQFIGAANTLVGANGVSWADVSANGLIGSMVTNPVSVKGASAKSLSYAALTAAGVYNFTGMSGITAQAAQFWAAYLDPTAIQARLSSLSVGFSGAAALAQIQSTPGPTLTGANRGVSTPLQRLQVLALSPTGVSPTLETLSQSLVTADVGQTGLKKPIGWVAPAVGLLVNDQNSGTNIDIPTEANFTQLRPAAQTSLAGLSALDSNHDGQITAADQSYSQLKLWFDTSQNGVSTDGKLETLAQAGVASISLTAQNQVHDTGDLTSNQILASATVTFTNGSLATLYDIALAVQAPSSTSSTSSATSSTTPSISQLNPLTATPSANLATPTVQAAGLSSTAGPTSNTPSSVSPSQIGEDGPAGTVISTLSSAQGALTDWTNSASATGLAALTSSIAAFQTTPASPSTQPTPAASAIDAAQMQQQLLLSQSITSFTAPQTAAAPVFARSGATDAVATLIAAAQSTQPTKSAPQLATVG